jgi:hypothetical protein
MPGDPRRGHVAPVAAFLSYADEQPMIIVELAFHPFGEPPEPLAPRSWTGYRKRLGLSKLRRASSLRPSTDSGWQIDFGPHTLVSNPVREFGLVMPRPDPDWECAVRAHGSCVVLLGTGFRADEQTGALAIPRAAAALSAAYAGSRSVPDLTEIPGLFVVPVNSLLPYDPLRPVTFILDTDVLISIQRFCFESARLGERVTAIRHLLVNLSDRDVLPGPALAQLYQPTRSTFQAAPALQALAAFEIVMALTRAELMDERRPPASFPDGFDRDLTGFEPVPLMLVMYAGVLRLRQLWNPGQSLAERARSFESFMRWLREELKLNAALLVQVAFNLWISDEDAKRQASHLLHFRAGPVTEATLARLWGTAFDLFLIAGHLDAVEIADAVDAVILTFDRGLAGMRDFFEHFRVSAPSAAGGPERGYAPNTRVMMNLHPRLYHIKPRVERLATELHLDMFARMAENDGGPYRRADLDTIVEREERLLLAVGQ